ncbi:nucleoporin [Maudiozyma humilis]|uniref:Nucleoporin n=1 Tax=Maudiozyma humilis TaxID=51915 RepID=A0AAV5S2P8_MAUHU|nr:nucleoporin [Kazachstania humilis]
MSKRGADRQMTREELSEASGSDNEGAPSTVATASADVMSRRKIAMPRRKMAFAGAANGAAKAESSFANAFNFAKKAPAPSAVDETPAKIKALNIQFRNKIGEFIDRDAFVDLSATIEKYKVYMSSLTGKAVAAAPSAVQKPLPTVAVPTVSIPKVAVPAVPAPTSAPSNHDSSSDDEDAETKIEGPAFTLSTKPITGDSVFSFGKQKAEKPKDDSDSESDIEIKGPAFTFSGAVKSDVFKFNGKKAQVDAEAPVTPSTETPKPALSFNFGAAKPAAEPAEKKEEPAPAPAPAAAAKPVFSFGTGSAPAPAAKPSFVFGATATETPAPAAAATEKPSFIFGAKPTEAPKSAFSFGAAAAAPKEEEKETKKPSFVFGAPAQDKEAAAPVSAFGFGAKTVDDDATKDKETAKPAAFGINGNNDAAKSAFSFGGKTNATEPAAPSFAFGAKPSDAAAVSTTPSTEKPSFTFGVNKDKDAPNPFGMSSTNTTSNEEVKKPSFTFGAPVTSAADKDEAKKDDKPKFSFGLKPASNDEEKETSSAEKKDDKPSFSFGASTTSAAPSFSFGKPADSNPFTKSATDKAAVPSGGFKFSLPFGQKGGDSPASSVPSSTPAAVTPANEAAQSATPATNTTTESTTEAKEETPINMQNGEEDENALFTQRAKLMVFNAETKSYDSRGVGEMKVLQKKDDKSKARLLCRSDGMGNILLNTNVVKSFEYVPLTADNENLVKTPVIDSDGKLTTFIVKFKAKADGRGFSKAIEDCKKDLE